MDLINVKKIAVKTCKQFIVKIFKTAKKNKERVTQRKECKSILNTLDSPIHLSALQQKLIKNYYNKYLSCDLSLLWHTLYINANNHFDHRYIPIDILFTEIIPFFNDKHFVDAYSDKNRYEDLFPDILHPKTILKKINGDYYLNNIIISEEEAIKTIPKMGTLIIKPTINTSQGNGVYILECNKLSSSQQVLSIFNKVGNNFIIQEKITSHISTNNLNPSSLNTLRVITYRKGSEVFILSITLKIGKKGSLVDNGHHGGYFCGVTMDGKLKKYLYTLNPFSRNEYTENGVKIFGIQLPNFETVCQTIKKCALKLPYARYVGWDIAINQEGIPVLIEINLKCPGGNIMQIPNGPLFGEYTTEILNEVFYKKN